MGSNDNRCLLAGVYLRPDYGKTDHLVGYEQDLAFLGDALNNCGTNRILCVGDFNADYIKQPRFYNAYTDYLGYLRSVTRRRKHNSDGLFYLPKCGTQLGLMA